MSCSIWCLLHTVLSRRKDDEKQDCGDGDGDGSSDDGAELYDEGFGNREEAFNEAFLLVVDERIDSGSNVL